ncbi:MAG: M28 family peptidase [Acidobacteria bacterium]|nr:M28 family peptidase [Acidobacteriota bacterium]
MRPQTFLVALFTTAALSAQPAAITGAHIRAHTKFLSSDLLEGRGVGSRGGDLATDYLATQFALAGLKPAGDKGTFFQAVPMVGVATEKSAQLALVKGGERVPLTWQDDFVGVTQRQQKQEEFEAEAVFVGHGITAPEFDWDDYRGIDVKGKIVVLFTNEPPSEDPKFFGGRALTYYGRWTYKYEQATRKGAVACIIVHTTPTAGYSWEVVRNSWGKEDPQMVLENGQAAMGLAGWVTRKAGDRLFAHLGKTVDDMVKLADTRGFKPVPLNIKLSAKLPTAVRPIASRNVVGFVEGSDPVLKNEAVVFSAHWDHLGIGVPVNGDAIYNGAVDNATGCATLLEIARVWAALPVKPRRSAIFLAVTAEESGLRGAEYYGLHPFIPNGKHALNVNYDALYPFGRTKDVVVTGAERTTVWPTVQDIARRFNLIIAPDARPEQGLYYRSDHFSLARVGVPAFSVKMGNELRSGSGSGDDFFVEFNSKNYHQPSDEYKESWDFAGMEELARFGMTIALEVANQDKLPTWKAGDEFLPARVASGVK